MNIKELRAGLDKEKLIRDMQSVELPFGLETAIVATNEHRPDPERSARLQKRRERARRYAERDGNLDRLREMKMPVKDILPAPAPMEAEIVSETPDPPVDPKVESDIARKASMTPEVRYHDRGSYSDDELKIIAAALVSRTALYKVADALHCSITRVKKAIETNPVLKQLMLEQREREHGQLEEAIDDCIKQRVPAVVMWKAERLMPEKYGTQAGIDNEDDTRIMIGMIPEDEVEAAEAEVAEAAKDMPPLEGGVALLDAMEEERAAEMAAAGAGVPVDPLKNIPPAPAVNPDPKDPRFMKFTPAANLVRVSDAGQDNYGVFNDGLGMGGDDYGSGADDYGAFNDGF